MNDIPENLQRWRVARDQFLKGRIDSSDSYARHWHGAMMTAAAAFFASARLQLHDLYRHDLSDIHRTSVRSVFNVELPPNVTVPLFSSAHLKAVETVEQ